MGRWPGDTGGSYPPHLPAWHVLLNGMYIVSAMLDIHDCLRGSMAWTLPDFPFPCHDDVIGFWR